MRQHEVFLQGEANAWFARNRIQTANLLFNKDSLMQLVEGIGLTESSRVLDVGAANGVRLAAIHRRWNCSVTAVEPSEQAIQDGTASFPAIRYIKGVSHDLSMLQDSGFDLVILSGVLVWVDRSVLLRTVAEVDRVLADQGWLIIGDFLPDFPQRVKYHHKPDEDVWTWKQDYAQVWQAANLYREEASVICDHNTMLPNAAVESAHRWKIVLLRKTLRDAYRMVELKR